MYLPVLKLQYAWYFIPTPMKEAVERYHHIVLVWIVAVKGYECAHCGKCYASKRLLADHIGHHKNNCQCSFCDMACPSPSALAAHIRYKHLDYKPFKCHTCDYAWVHTEHNPADVSVQSHWVRFQLVQIQGDVCAALLMLGYGHLRCLADRGKSTWLCS
jgi:hypothetical protein